MMKTNLNAASSQEALDYIMYMMVGSIFRETECESRRKEGQLFLNYQNLPDRTRQKMEDACAWFADRVLAAKLPQKVLDARVEAYFRPVTEERVALCFRGIDWGLEVDAVLLSAGKYRVRVSFLTRSGRQVRCFELANRGDYSKGNRPAVKVTRRKGFRIS